MVNVTVYIFLVQRAHTHTHKVYAVNVIHHIHNNTSRLKTRSLAVLIWRHGGSKLCSTGVSWRLTLQVQRIYHSTEADKYCSICMAKENKMSTCPLKKTSYLHVHSSCEMNQKNPPICVLSRPGAHVYALQAIGLTAVGNLFETLRCLSSWRVSKISFCKVVEDFWRQWSIRANVGRKEHSKKKYFERKSHNVMNKIVLFIFKKKNIIWL